MATDPRIKYDILANTQGEPEVEKLAQALERVDKAIDPVAAQRAQELAAQLRTLGQQNTAIDTFVNLKNKVAESRTELGNLQQQAQKLGAELAKLDSPTRTQVGQLEKLRDAVRTGKTELQAQVQALDASRAALGRLGISTDQVASAQQRVRTQLTETQAAAQQLSERYTQTAQAASASSLKQVAAQAEVQKGLTGIGETLSKLQTLAAAAFGGTIVTQAAHQVADVADQYNNLAARVKLVSGSSEEFNSSFQGVFDIATRTGTAVETVGNLFTKVAQASKLPAKQSLELTEIITKGVVLSGESAQASEAAIVQLTQGLQAGALRGQDFNSVVEQSPRVARALADGLGATTGELRKLAEQGALTADVVIQALIGQGAAITREFSALPPTVGRALQNLNTEWTRYVGEADKATGASATAAGAIQALAQNLDTVVGAVKAATEVYLIYKAVDLAGSLLRQSIAIQAVVKESLGETSARAAATAATVAHTRAVVADTVAQEANAVASAASSRTAGQVALQRVAAVGVLSRMLGIIGLVTTAAALFGDVIASAFSKAGKFIGESVAKLQGYKDRSDEVLANQKAMDEAARQSAQARAAEAQALQIAADKALGLSDAARKIIGDFTELEKKGESTATILAKVTKDLDLGNIKGINDGIAALDALEQKGKITGAQIREALATALDGKDLGAFEAQARAAFDSSEQGARRLADALDAIGAESVRRVGSSLDELATGFSKASASAINDVDALAAALKKAGANADDAARLLGTALDKALVAANTEKAVQAVIDRLKDLGKQGLITGDQLAEGLDKAKKKIDDLKPGISSLDEALRNFGLQTRAELQATADKLGQSYRLIANEVSVSLQEKAEAFQKYADAATAANGGVETSEVKLQRVMLENKLAAAGLGDSIADAMSKAKKSTDAAASAQERYLQLLQSDPSRLASGTGLGGIVSGGGGATSQAGGGATPPAGGGAGSGGGGGTSLGDDIRNTKSGQITRTLGFQLTPPDNTPGWEFDTAKYIANGSPIFATNEQAFPYWRHKPGTVPGTGQGGNAFGGKAGTPPAPNIAPAPAPAPGQPTATPSSVVRIDLNVNGKTYPVNAADQASADALLAALQSAKRLAGY